MHQLEQSLQLLRDIGFSRNEFCITGSSGLALWSRMAESRGYAPLFNRNAGDVDVLSINPCFSRAAHNCNLHAARHLGLDDCLNIDMGESSLDLTRQWPTLLIDTSKSIEEVSSEIFGFRVMNLGYIATLKQQFNRPKDRADLAFLDQALRPSRKLSFVPANSSVFAIEA